MEVAPQKGMQRGKVGGGEFRFGVHDQHSG
jgi:hypothetical protein